MNVFRRGCLSMLERKKKNIILLNIFFLLLLILFIVYFAFASTQNRIQFVRKALGNMITIYKENTKDMGICLFSDKDIATIKSVDNIESVNILTYHEMELQNMEPYSEDEEAAEEYDETMRKSMEAAGLTSYIEPNSQMFSVTNSQELLFFTGSGFYLSEGKAITVENEGENVVLISEELARLNQLGIGDTIEVKMPYMDRSLGMSSDSLNLMVQGIFHWEPIAESSKVRSASPGNFLFVPNQVLKETYMLEPSLIYVYSQDSFALNDTVKELKGVLGDSSMDADSQEGTFIYKWDNTWGEEVGEPLKEVKKVTAVILIIFLVGALIIIGIITSFVIRERHHEILVYQGLGERKTKIVMQVLFEIMCILTVAAISAGIITVIVAPATNNMIASPYNKIVETKLKAEKDEKLFDDSRNAVSLNTSLYEDTIYLKNSNENISFHMQLIDIVLILIVLFIVIPVMIICTLMWQMRNRRTG